MRPPVRAAVATAAVVSLAIGCSGDGEGTTETPTATETQTSEQTEPSPTLPDGGTDAVSDLSSFVCEPGSGGDWTATGVLTSSADEVASFEVTVVVAGADAGNPDARRRVLADLAPDVPTDVEIDGIPAPADVDATCQVQVVRLAP